jgi:hypothetical protein
MALPLTVQTELALAPRRQNHQSMHIDQEIEGRETEAVPHTPIDKLEALKELGMMIMPNDLDAIPEHFTSATKMVPKNTNAALEYHTKILIKDLHLPPAFNTMIEIDVRTSDPELEVVHRTEQVEARTGTIAVDNRGEMSNGEETMIEVMITKAAGPTLT